MYLHRYPHIQSIHPYINSTQCLHIPPQCICPPFYLVVKSHSQLFSRHYNLQCPQSQMWAVLHTGLIKSNLSYNDVLMAACKLSPVSVETDMGYFVGYLWQYRVECVCSSQTCSLLLRNSLCTKLLDK